MPASPALEAGSCWRLFRRRADAATCAAHAAMQCASLLREAMWSMVSELHLGAGVDYVAYTGKTSPARRALDPIRTKYGKHAS
jgi:exoribonuclease R